MHLSKLLINPTSIDLEIKETWRHANNRTNCQ